MTFRYTIGAAVPATAACVLLLGLSATGAAQDAETSPGETYAQLLAEADSLRRYNSRTEQLLTAQQGDIASLNEQLVEIDATAAAIPPLLERMHAGLTEFVADDLPFLPDERADRLNRLEEIMAQEGMPSEKFRRLMEAYLIELEYGRSLEAYRGTLTDGREANIVRLGRVALLYRTIDGAENGYWDAAAGAWVADQAYARVIEQALGIATEQLAPDLITVPVPAAEESRS